MRARLSLALAWCAAASCALAACEPATSIESALLPERATVYEGAARAVIPIGPGRALIDAEDGLWIVGEPGSEPERVGEPDELGAIRAASALEDATLIAGESAVLLVRGATLGAAPVSSALAEDESIVALAVTARARAEPDLWIATTEGLYLFRGERLTPIRIDAHPLARAAIAASSEAEIWAVAGERLLRIAIAGDAVRATLLERPLSVRAIASDDRGVPYVIAEGALHAIERDGTLVRFDLGSAPIAVRASGNGPDVWVETAGGSFHIERRTARPVAIDGELVPGIDGEAFVMRADRVERIRARHRLAIEGMHDAASLVDRTEVTIATYPDAAIDAWLDTSPIEAASGSIVLDPIAISIGAHVLTVRATFRDGTLPVRARVRFTVAPTVTWTEHIQPIYAEACSDCHGAAGPAPTRLDARAAWETNIVRILDNVRAGRMPLGRPPLDPARIEMIETWSQTGFPE